MVNCSVSIFLKSSFLSEFRTASSRRAILASLCSLSSFICPSVFSRSKFFCTTASRSFLMALNHSQACLLAISQVGGGECWGGDCTGERFFFVDLVDFGVLGELFFGPMGGDDQS